jgi:hypothetical protein
MVKWRGCEVANSEISPMRLVVVEARRCIHSISAMTLVELSCVRASMLVIERILAAFARHMELEHAPGRGDYGSWKLIWTFSRLFGNLHLAPNSIHASHDHLIVSRKLPTHGRAFVRSSMDVYLAEPLRNWLGSDG